jgi:RNase adapter protein RapZ
VTATPPPQRILFVTGLSGAGKSTALRTFEDLGWEVVDNLPIRLLDRLLETPLPPGGEAERALAVGIDSRTREFDARRIVARIDALAADRSRPMAVLFLDCSVPELERRFSETRRRHPMALDRPAADGIAEERELVGPLRQFADTVLDTTEMSANALQAELRQRFDDAGGQGAPVLSLLTFGFKRGVPRNADLVFDMRFLRNPFWDTALRPLTGHDQAVADYVTADPAYAEALERIGGLLLFLLPRYRQEGKSYVTVAIGCTGGRHRSVHFAEQLAGQLREGGFSPTVSHRDLPEASGGKVLGVDQRR